jgi:hypothetical protein
VLISERIKLFPSKKTHFWGNDMPFCLGRGRAVFCSTGTANELRVCCALQLLCIRQPIHAKATLTCVFAKKGSQIFREQARVSPQNTIPAGHKCMQSPLAKSGGGMCGCVTRLWQSAAAFSNTTWTPSKAQVYRHIRLTLPHL